MKFLQLRIGNGLFQILILKFGHFATFRTYHVMMGFIVVRTLVLGRIAELMFNNQFCIDKKNDGIIKSSPLTRNFPSFAYIIKLYIKMPLNGL